MKHVCHWLLCIVMLGCGSSVQAQHEPQVRVEMSADRTELTTQDNVTLRIYVQAQGAGQPDIEVPELEGFQVVQRAVQRPMQFSFGFGNSQPVVTSTTQYTFVLVPMGAGTFKIPPVKVSFGQRVFQSKALVLTVTAPDGTRAPQGTAPQPAQPAQGQPGQSPATPQAPGAAAPNGQAPNAQTTPAAQNTGDAAVFDNEAFLRTVVDKVAPYEGEQVTATLYLYTRHNLQQAPSVQAEASTDGFWVQDLLSATRTLDPTRQVINGRGFWVYTLRRFAAFPLRSGDLTIGSMALTISRETVFDIFDPSRGGPAELQRRSVPVLLHVKPLPAEGKPAAPTAPIAVGSFDLDGSLDRSQVATGDAVTWTATLRGKGNLRAIKLPDPQVKGLQILQPEVRDLTESPGDRVTSTRSFSWLVVPEAPGRYELPVLTLDTFDPATGAYHRITSPRLTLTAAGSAVAGTTGAARPAPGKGADDATDPGDRDEAWPPLHTRSVLERPTTRLASRAFYLPLLLLWPIAWLGLAFGPSAIARMRARGAGTREQIAMRSSRKRLQDAQRALAGHDARRFHADVASALSGALEVRLGENISGLTQNALRKRLAECGVAETTSSGVCEVLAQCDFARFSSANVSDADMQKSLARSEQLWSELEAFTPSSGATGHTKAHSSRQDA